MKKLNETLIKKVELLEKLAAYGNRHAFLQSLATLEEFNAAFMQAKEHLANAKQSLGGEAALIDAPATLEDVERQIARVRELASASPDQRKANPAISELFLAKHSLDEAKELKPTLPTVDEEMVLPQDAISAVAPKPVYVPKDVQRILGVKQDGILGRETRTALDNFKKLHNLQNMTDAQLFNRVMGEELIRKTPF